MLAVYNWPRDTDRYRRVATFIDAFFTKFPEFQKPRAAHQVEGDQPQLRLEGLEALSGSRGVAGEERRKAGEHGAAVAIDPGIVRAQAAKAAPNDPAEQERLFQAIHGVGEVAGQAIAARPATAQAQGGGRWEDGSRS